MQEYPIGRASFPWNEEEKRQWFQAQHVKRSYAAEVLNKYANVSTHFTKHQYGAIPIDANRYPLFAFTNAQFNAKNPSVLITGGVHGYETSGVQGALEFLLHHAIDYSDRFNFIIAPCVSPWGYETVNRWTTNAIDPNRSFEALSLSPEAKQIMDFVKSVTSSTQQKILAHFDLHETTDTDNTEFRPALAARDSIVLAKWEVPDGFYTVADTKNPQIPFQEAVIAAVEKVTHIAPSDKTGKIIGEETVAKGVICYDKTALKLCGGFTGADYVTTTEVYPDSPHATLAQCIAAQVAAIRGGLDFLLSHKS